MGRCWNNNKSFRLVGSLRHGWLSRAVETRLIGLSFSPLHYPNPNRTKHSFLCLYDLGEERAKALAIGGCFILWGCWSWRNKASCCKLHLSGWISIAFYILTIMNNATTRVRYHGHVDIYISFKVKWGDKGSTEAASHLEKTKDAKEITTSVTMPDENANPVKHNKKKSSLCVRCLNLKLDHGYYCQIQFSTLCFLPIPGWNFLSIISTVCMAGQEKTKKREDMVRDGSAYRYIIHIN